jgi:hypothetical protein
LLVLLQQLLLVVARCEGSLACLYHLMLCQAGCHAKHLLLLLLLLLLLPGSLRDV